jgi:hypothetical protein
VAVEAAGLERDFVGSERDLGSVPSRPQLHWRRISGPAVYNHASGIQWAEARRARRALKSGSGFNIFDISVMGLQTSMLNNFTIHRDKII